VFSIFTNIATFNIRPKLVKYQKFHINPTPRHKFLATPLIRSNGAISEKLSASNVKCFEFIILAISRFVFSFFVRQNG